MVPETLYFLTKLLKSRPQNSYSFQILQTAILAKQERVKVPGSLILKKVITFFVILLFFFRPSTLIEWNEIDADIWVSPSNLVLKKTF